jgi:hypothetical protein
MVRTTLPAALLTVTRCAAWSAPAAATPQFLTESKKAGMSAKNCQYCHTSAMPKKYIKVEWLKDYPGGKEQK